jgi:hypothetical protein
MAQLPGQYNTPENNETVGFDALPAGKYAAQVVKSEYKETKAKTGHYLQLVVKIISGDYKGRQIFENLNLDNPNPQAVEIANKTLNSICQACGLAGVEDSEQLHGIPMEITLRKDKETDDYPESNSITAYRPLSVDDVTEDSSEGSADTSTGGKKLPWE